MSKERLSPTKALLRGLTVGALTVGLTGSQYREQNLPLETSPTLPPITALPPTLAPTPEKTVIYELTATSTPTILEPPATPTPTPTPEAGQEEGVTPTPEAADQGEAEKGVSFPETGRARSEHVIFSLSKGVMETASIQSISVPPETLETARKLILVDWANKAAQWDGKLTVFKNVDPKNLEQILTLYDNNRELLENYEFDFGHDVRGKVSTIEARMVMNEKEWESLLLSVSSGEEYGKIPVTAENYPSSSIKTLFFFDQGGGFHAWSCYVTPEERDYLSGDEKEVREALATTLHTPLVQGEYCLTRTASRRLGPAGGVKVSVRSNDLLFYLLEESFEIEP